MKIKKLVALALAGTMVFSMAACGDKEKEKSSSNDTTSASENKTEADTDAGNTDAGNSDAGNSEVSDVSLETVLEAFNAYVETNGKNSSYDTYMAMKMSAEGMTIDMVVDAEIKNYDNVTYTKTTSKTSMMGASEETTEEGYRIIKEDGSEVVASRTVGEDEWDMGSITSIDMDLYDAFSGAEFSADEMKDLATMENNGDECVVTVKYEASEMDSDMFEGLDGIEMDIIITYNVKEASVTGIAIDFDIDAFNEMNASMGVTYEELELEMSNIKKLDQPIEVPSEIQLD